MSTPTGPGDAPGPRDWSALPPENVYELRVTLDGQPVEVITVTRGEWTVAKQIVGEMRLERWMYLAPTVTVEILTRRALSCLVGASIAMSALRWYGHLAVSWWLALGPFLLVVLARLVRWCILRYRRSRNPLHVADE